ncbi:pentapeptide repeat-containing protein [Chamaesiphon sp. OTE_20_metabat_361]|uniref:pentapeptide repeat-containing protein n=1 Tax=Chamaesiphon sp. OTE_20_metabat_361 TaxID=2964689 RepID=UPI00286CAF68|nr:pentapeptide repeat-containing protein [Chamaesiphon sp. OTE_20_metabat_361]
MNRSRLWQERASGSSGDDDLEALPAGSWRLPAAIAVGSLLLGGIWFFQQTSLRHLNEQIQQLQQDIDKISHEAISPVARVNLEKEPILLERDRINAQNGVYDVLFDGIGTLLLGGLAYAGWQYLRRAEARWQLTYDRSITDRFSQAISHLASDKVEIRLGGIYTLECLARDSPAEYWLTIEVLTAFVRERSARVEVSSPPRWEKSSTGDPPSPAPSRRLPQSLRIPTDIQAVMTILTRRDSSKDLPDRIIELRQSNLRNADLNGIELWGANLWQVNLRQAHLWQAKLAGASLGRANLSDASLWQADLEDAYLWKANLEGADLSSANLAGANLEGANLKSTNLEGANLINADLRQTVGLTRQQLSLAICDETTQLPAYLEAVIS